MIYWNVLPEKKINIVFSPPGTGKCLGKNTGILMFDGSTKMVQDIKIGDVLMGWDSKPRNVLAIGTGQEELFKIIPNKGEPWICNKSHILSVIESGVWNSKNGSIPNSLDIQDIDITKMLTFSKNNRKKII
jgi:replicative DNA helicase